MSAPISRGEPNPYAPVVVENLVEDFNEWRNVTEVVRLTFKALSDVVRTQGVALSRLEQQLAAKANIQEVITSLALKANVADVQRSMTEVVRAMEQKATIQDCRLLIAEKASKTELYSAEGRSDSAEELRRALVEIEGELEMLKNQFVSQADLQEVYDVCATKAQLTEVEEAVQNKANKQSVASALHRKADKSEVEGSMDYKAGLEELRNLIDSKVSFSAYERLSKEVALKADASAVDRLLSTSSTQRQDLELAELRELRLQRSSEAAIALQIDSVISATKAETDRAYSTLHSMLSKKADVRDLDRISQLLARKADTENITDVLEDFRKEISQHFNSVAIEVRKEALNTTESDKLRRIEVKVKELDSELKLSGKQLKELGVTLQDELNRVSSHFSDYRANKATDIIEIKRRLDLKADCSEIARNVAAAMQEQGGLVRETRRDLGLSIDKLERELMTVIGRKADFAEVKQYLDSLEMKTAEALSSRQLVKSLQSELDKHIAATKGSFDETFKSVMLKANIKDVCTLLDLKANSDEVSRAFADFSADLEARALSGEMNAFTQEQLLVNEVLCAENCVGRWIWKSGALLGNYAVPWEVQSVNTCPDNFLWEKDKSTLVAVAPGLYQVCWGFFAKRPPTLQLSVNGEPVFIETSK
jgi:hypothetical protein